VKDREVDMDMEELFSKFKLAIENEYEAYQLYRDIAYRSDGALRVLFERLAGEEWEHRELIMRRYRIMKGLAD
jgi:rubrerythrin